MLRDLRIQSAETVLFSALIGWLTVAVLVVNIEYYDGFSAIANARYFLGLSDRYVFDRGPMMAWLLMPAEWLRSLLDLRPLEVRPHHALMALLHAVYLILSYALLVRHFGRTWVGLLAFAAAVPTFLFFSYAPFISHDLAPGLLLFSMLSRADRFAECGRATDWVYLAVLGTVAALVKQTFGLFWMLILVVQLVRVMAPYEGHRRGRRATLWWLTAGALTSGASTWVLLGIILTNEAPQTPLLIRPYENLHYLANVYKGTTVEFPIWLYLRNCSAYGCLTSVLIVPGLVLSLRGTRLQRDIAIAWIVGVVFMHLLPLREVRYLGFLAPLSACLLIPAVHAVGRRPAGAVVIGALLAADLLRCSSEATQIANPFYRGGVQQDFFSVVEQQAAQEKPVFVNAPMFSFVAPVPSPLAADRYHRVFHFGVQHIEHLLGVRDLQRIADFDTAFHVTSRCPEGSVLLYASQVLARPSTWTGGPPAELDRFFQCAAICRSQIVQVTGPGAAPGEQADTVVLTKVEEGSQSFIIMNGQPCARIGYGELLCVAVSTSDQSVFPLQRASPEGFQVLGANGAKVFDCESLVIRRFAIDRRLVGSAQ